MNASGAGRKLSTFLALVACGTICRAQTGPSIATISPASIWAGSPGFSLTVTGTNFNPGSVLLWNSNAPLAASIVSASQLTVAVPASFVASAGSANLVVQNAAGARSNIAAFKVAQPAISIGPATWPTCFAGSPYTLTFVPSGGTPPYRWGFAGTLPDGLTLSAGTGVLAGTPNTRGTYGFTILVTDSTGATGIKTFSFVVATPPLVITTDSPIFNGTLGLFYSQTFQASGGISPYKWSLLDGALPVGLVFEGNTGAISGTPALTGAFQLTVQATDSDGAKVSKSFQFTVDSARLTILTTAPLANGTAGNAYSQQFTAAGGMPPYTWSMPASLAGLSLDASTGILAGIAPVPGPLSFTVSVKDAAGRTASKPFTLAIAPTPLTITSNTKLADGVLSLPYLQSLAVTGGTPPYTWSANGLPDGLRLDPETGSLSGAPLAGGDLVLTVKVTDSVRATAIDLFHIKVVLPSLPDCIITGLPDIASPADQPYMRLSLNKAYPVALAGQLTLSFAPDSGSGDATVQFITGGRTAAFTIPAGSTEAEFAVSRLAIQTGTLAGTITISAQFLASDIDITPNPQPARTIHVDRRAPVITTATLARSDSGFKIVISGFSTTREVTQALFRFKPASGSTLQQTEVTIQVDSLFANWYQDAASMRYGSQFTFTQPFTISGDASAVLPESVTLSNRVGTTTATVH